MSDDDKYNVNKAETLANKALHLPLSEAVPIYEQILAAFPTAAKYWKQYVEAHMSLSNDDATKLIFSRCLLNCLNVPLWRCYIRFIRKINSTKGTQGHEETRKAFDFMLTYVGADIASGPLWLDYIAFLKSLPALNSQEESQRMTYLRKAYQKAILTPTHQIEQIWKDYENFENSVSRALAKGLLSEYQSKYNSARAVYLELKKLIDEIDWSTLAVPPTGSYKEEIQWMSWRRLIAFEKTNPQRIDSVSSNKRIVYTYEQCLMHLYHYPDLWYDYATWHAKSDSVEAAIKVFQRALKALPDSEMLRYAYAELEESRGSIQAAKIIYEGFLGDCANPTALTHIQYIRFLRRTEGAEAARKYFLEARKSTNCTYEVYVAYAMMTFCLDKDPKAAHNIFEAGLKIFMHEPIYILEYADFLSRLNDDRNIRALFERSLSSLPSEESVEVWKQFTKFEQTYGDLARMLKVEERRKEALMKTGHDEGSTLECSLQDVVSRYSFMDLWPCSSKDLDHLARQEVPYLLRDALCLWLARNSNKKFEKLALPIEASSTERSSSALATNSKATGKIVFPDTSRMVIYDPAQKPGTAIFTNTTMPGLPATASTLQVPKAATDQISKATPPALSLFIANLPLVDGPSPDVDIVLSILLQSNIPAKITLKPEHQSSSAALGPNTRNHSVSNKAHPAPRSSFQPTKGGRPGKRKDIKRQEEDETVSVQSAPLPRDVFRIRHSQKSRGGAPLPQQSSSAASYGSAFSGDRSGSTG